MWLLALIKIGKNTIQSRLPNKLLFHYQKEITKPAKWAIEHEDYSCTNPMKGNGYVTIFILVFEIKQKQKPNPQFRPY